MASLPKRKGIAITKRPAAARRNSILRRNRSSKPKAEQQLPPGYRNGEWPLKRILREEKQRYLEYKRNVGKAAIEEWEIEKQQTATASQNNVTPQNERSVPTVFSKRGKSVRRRDQEGSRAIVREEYKAPRIHRPKYSKKRVVPSSSPSIEIPETQQEVLPYRETVAVEVKRPVDFHSQDYSTVAGSQVISVAVTEDTAVSKDTTEGDSTLGSSVPPDSPIQTESGNSTREESSSNASPSHPRAGPGFWNNIVTNFTGYKQSVSSSVDRPRGGQQSQYSSLKLLVDRSDSIGEADTLPSRLTAQPAEHRDSIQPSSSFLAARAADLDLQPIVDPDQSRRKIESEVGLEFLSAISSPGGSRNQDGVGLRPPPTPEPAVTGRRTRRSQSGNLSSPRRLAASRAELRHHGAPERLTTPIRVVRGKPTSPNDSEILAASNLLSTALSMSNSQQEPSPHMERPPPETSEKTQQPDFRDQLRQLRAAARNNQNSRSRSQAKTGQTSSPGGEAVEMKSSRHLSPEKNSQSAATSTPTQDQPIPSLENVDAAAGEMEVDEVDGEPALSSSLALPPPVLDAALGKSIMPLHLHEAEPAISELDIPTMPLLQPAEFVVPLPIDGRIKHQYVAELKERYKDIDDFLNFPRSKRLVDAMGDMIGQLNNTVVHTDLGLNGSMTQTASTTEEVLWAEDASSKFAFLAQIISILRGSDHHIVVVARSGPTLDLIQTYLRGKNVNYRQHSRTGAVGDLQEGDRDDPMRYTLLSTHSESLKYLPRSASLIIAFDDSFDAAMLPAWCPTSRFIPILLLLVINSAEHVGRCIAQDTPEPERLRRLVKAVVHVHKELGEMPFHIEFRHDLSLDPGVRLALVKKDLGAKITHAAQRTAEALQSGNFALNFKLRPIGELDLAGLEDQPLSTEESKEVSSSASRAGTPAGQKRLRDERSSSAIQAKRQRLTPMRDVTHISDSIKHSQPQIDELKAALKKAQQEVSAERKARQKAEESAAYLDDCSKEIRHSLATLQYRYETRMKQVHELKLEKQNILAEREGDDQRREKLQAENITLKDQQLQLQEELHTARDALKNSGNSSIAELELARETARTATDDAHRLQTSVDNIRKDFDFTRSAYQDASTKAAEYASQVSDLESANAELKRQASDERRRLAALNHSENRKRDLGRIAELEAELRNLSAVVGRVEEENKSLRKGRGGVATRGSSAQPGAGAASPRPGGGGGGGGPGSRGGSPAPGALLGANTHQFHVAPVGGRASALRNER